jgi:AcrR family transcriptional regulator
VARPRDRSLDEAILTAARDIAHADGPAAVTIVAVAERAGVARPTVYRRWASRAALLFELELSETVPPELPDLGSLHAELGAAMRHLVDQVAAGDRQIDANQLGEIVRDRAFAEGVWRRRWIPDRNVVLTIWQRAVDRGEVDPAIDGTEVIEDIVAAAVFRVLLWHRTDHDWIEPYLDRLLDGVRVDR